MHVFDLIIVIAFCVVCILILKDIATYIKVRYNLNYSKFLKKLVAGIMATVMYVFLPVVYSSEELEVYKEDICMPTKKFDIKDYVDVDEETGKKGKIKKKK